MSYQATYTTSINPRIASDALKNIGRNFLQISESIRVGSEKCTAAMDSLMNKQNGFLININELKSKYDYECRVRLKNNPAMGLTEAKIRSIESFPELKNFAEMTLQYKTLHCEPSLMKGRVGKIKVDSVVEETFSMMEKSLVDIQTVLVTKAITNCNWKLIDSASELHRQTIVAQNFEGSVLAINIDSNNVNLDISGFCDESCVNNAEQLINELDKMGLKSNLSNEWRHHRPSGGTLLSGGRGAKKIINRARRKNDRVSILTYRLV